MTKETIDFPLDDAARARLAQRLVDRYATPARAPARPRSFGYDLYDYDALDNRRRAMRFRMMLWVICMTAIMAMTPSLISALTGS